jgi:ABC-2 type transport system permease protein
MSARAGRSATRPGIPGDNGADNGANDSADHGAGKGAVAAALPGAWSAGLARTGIELKTFFRDKQSVAFVFSLPAVLLVLLGSIFRSMAAGHGMTVGTLFAAGLIGGGIASTSFQYLGIGIATERDRGLLKRLRGTPMPPVAYFIGKTGLVVVCTVAETLLLIAVGMLIDNLHLPTAPGRWWTFAWVFVLGTICFSLLGIAISSLPRSARSATAVVMMPLTVLQFISGVYVPATLVPPWLRDIASFFPLKWICQALRSVFLPQQAVVLEPAGSWEHGRTAMVLVAWIVIGLVLCLTTFRWRSSRDG